MKGLEALEIIKHTTDLNIPNELNGYADEIAIIEKALKEREELKKCLKSEMKHSAFLNRERLKDYKALKALEIIKEKPRTLFLVQTYENYDTYSTLAQDIALIEDIYSPEEYDLLKEVLL